MSILDTKRETLNPTVWDVQQDPPTLKPEVKSEILQRADAFLGDTPMQGVFLVGSNTGYRYNEISDIDVSLVVPADDETLEQMSDALDTVNGKPLSGTKHPVNFYLMQDTPDPRKFNGMYSLQDDTWLSAPEDHGADLSAYYDQFRHDLTELDTTTGEAWRSLVDVDLMRDALPNAEFPEHLTSKLKRRLDTLNTSIQELAETYDAAKRKRLYAFLLYSEGGKIPPSPDLLPENVRYKILERYHYLDFLRALHKLTEETGDIDTLQDIEDLQDVFEKRPALQKARAWHFVNMLAN